MKINFSIKSFLFWCMLLGAIFTILGWVVYRSIGWVYSGGENTIELNYELEPTIKVTTEDGVSDTTYVYKIPKQ